MTPDEIKKMKNHFEQELKQKALSLTELRKKLEETAQNLKLNLIEQSKPLMRLPSRQVGTFVSPPNSRELEQYSDDELIANVHTDWLEDPTLEKLIIQLISLRSLVFNEEEDQLKALEQKVKENKDPKQETQFLELYFDHLCREIKTSCRNTEFLIRKNSLQDGPGLPDALKSLELWQSRRNELDAFIAQHPSFQTRPEVHSNDVLEFLDLRTARLNLEGWLNHASLEDLRMADGKKLSAEQLALLKYRIKTLYPLIIFPIIKET